MVGAPVLLALAFLGLATAAGFTTRLRPLRWLLLGSVGLAMLAWVPLFVVGTLDPASNPIGLGLLAVLGSWVGLGGAAIGLAAWALEYVVELWRARGGPDG